MLAVRCRALCAVRGPYADRQPVGPASRRRPSSLSHRSLPTPRQFQSRRRRRRFGGRASTGGEASLRSLDPRRHRRRSQRLPSLRSLPSCARSACHRPPNLSRRRDTVRCRTLLAQHTASPVRRKSRRRRRIASSSSGSLSSRTSCRRRPQIKPQYRRPVQRDSSLVRGGSRVSRRHNRTLPRGRSRKASRRLAGAVRLTRWSIISARPTKTRTSHRLLRPVSAPVRR
jgi:hypothetical protein